MANELKENAYCGKCVYYKCTTSPFNGFCEKRRIATKDKAVCGCYRAYG